MVRPLQGPYVHPRLLSERDPHQCKAPLQSDLALTTLLAIPCLVSHFANLPPTFPSHFLLTILRHPSLPVLRTLYYVLTPRLWRDIVTLLPLELVCHVLNYLPFSTFARALCVSETWRTIMDPDAFLWLDLINSTNTWLGVDSDDAFAHSIYSRRRRELMINPRPTKTLPLTRPYMNL
ncbi:hypothetical protein DFP72DRAFT_895833 [Ephemerocybe angulata]|uniref:F-box domain-containing protein n=1 Tax=Ephemerocybe angulata TaxID=980116 RepID=A0A8H6I121_9AGAR|nr:hypothetical protein DFP72DRAFT_895833 [Tulosesus angulatus]